MTFEEDYLRLLGQIGTFTKEVTGVSIIDAYFGPENLSPEKARRPSTPERLLMNLDMLIGKAKEINDELRRTAITSNLESLKIVVRWLSGENIPYTSLVEGIFGIIPSKFGQDEIRKARQKVEDASASLPGSGVSEKILKWGKESEISGEALRKLIDTEVVELTKQIETSFEKQVFAYFPTKVRNKGVVYKNVRNEPWSAYNYYQGNYTSITAINIDTPIKKHWLMGGLCHEYEHHVANLFREKYCRENKSLDLAAVVYHTKESVIDEGTADCAREFLRLQGGEFNELLESLKNLRSMIDINAAYMLIVQNVDDETTAEYISSESFAPIEAAKKLLGFIKPLTPDGRPNFFKPYIYTYFFGRKDYVLPTFQRAQKKNKLEEFFQTLYLNPYSRSTATWKIAFSKI